jgi:DNA-binding CsgD family transcriptional regulator
MSNTPKPNMRKQFHPSKSSEAVEKRERQAMELVLAGANYSEIGRAVGMHPSSARKLVLRVLNDLTLEHREKVDKLRELEARRLDRLLMRYWQDAQNGNLAAADRVLALSKRRSELLGLNLPTQVEVGALGGGPLRVTEVVIQTVTKPDDAD